MHATREDVLIMEEKPGDFEPTEQEIRDYSLWLGIDPQTEPDLLYIARAGIMEPLPQGWQPCQDRKGQIFFHNAKTGQSTWEHPGDQKYIDMVREVRQKRCQVQATQAPAGSDSSPPPVPAEPKNNLRDAEEVVSAIEANVCEPDEEAPPGSLCDSDDDRGASPTADADSLNVWAAGIAARTISKQSEEVILVAASSCKDGAASTPNAGAESAQVSPEVKIAAASAVGGAVLCGTVGGTAGTVVGGFTGAAVGILPAFFTFGLSIPVFAIIGSGAGLCLGATTGGGVGLVAGGAAGYGGAVYRARRYASSEVPAEH